MQRPIANAQKRLTEPVILVASLRIVRKQNTQPVAMYAILRTEKLKTAGNIGGLNAHLTRTMKVPNADPELARFNYRPVGSSDLWADVQNRLKEAGIEKTRKDGVLAVEHLATYSPEGMASFRKESQNGKPAQLVADKPELERWNAFVTNTRKWLCERYGEKNLVNFTVHMDEKSPHIHAVVVPIDQKGKLNCKSYLGGREKMQKMQDSFAQAHKGLNLERGIKGSKVNHQEVKHFYTRIKEANRYLVHAPELKPPQISLSEPDTKGFLNRMVFDPVEYVSFEQKRLREQNKDIHQQNQQLVHYSLSELSKQAQSYVHASSENERLRKQLMALKNEVSKQKGIIREGKELLDGVASGAVKPEELRLAKEQKPEFGNKRQERIQNAMEGMGCEIKVLGKGLGFRDESEMGIDM